MIDLDEARKIVMKRINSRSPEGVEEFVITGVQEKPYGWVFSWGAANGEHIAGNVPIVVEKKTGEATSLYASGVNPAVGIVWFERELAWREHYDAALELFLDAALKIWAEAPVKWSREDLLEWCAETMDCYASNVLMRDGRRVEADKMRLRVKELLIGNPG